MKVYPYELLVPGGYGSNLKYAIFKTNLVIDILILSCEFARIWMSQYTTDELIFSPEVIWTP